MRSKKKIIALGVAFFLVLIYISTFFVQTIGNENDVASPIRVACVGDSITGGTEYPVDLWYLLGSNYVVGDFGVGGATVNLNSESRYLNHTAFQVVEEFEPNIIIIMLGTNDANTDLNESNAVFVANYVELVIEFQALASKPKVWIVQPPPFFNNSVGLNPEYFTQNIVPSIKKAANQMNLPLIDAYAPFVNHPEYFIDGVHPNADCAQTIADLIYHKIFSIDDK